MSDGALTQRRSLSVEHGHLVRGGAPINADVRRIGGLGHRASFPPPAAPWCLVVPCTGAGSAIPHWTSTTIRPTGARLRVRCLRARGSSGAPSETADFERSNGTGFESRCDRLVGQPLYELSPTSRNGEAVRCPTPGAGGQSG